MSDETLYVPRLQGTYLAQNPRALELLAQAATARLPASVIAVLNVPDVTAAEITALLFHEQSTERGFWRIALAGLIFAVRHDQPLPDLPPEIRTQASAVIAAAEKAHPQLYSPSFVEHCASILAGLEKGQPESEDAGTSDSQPQIGPRRVARSGAAPTVHLLGSTAITSTRFTLLDERDKPFLSDELLADDLLFVAHSALSACRSALLSARDTVKADRLFRLMDDEVLQARREGIKENLDVILEILSTLPVMSEDADSAD